MMRLLSGLLIIVSLSVGVLGRLTPAQAATCQFVLGFKTLHDAIANVVGDCLVDEHHNPQNGDALQETNHGLLVWRKADNWTAFTDGYRTWVNGPSGIVTRLNTERFCWEGDANQAACLGQSAASPTATPTNPVQSNQFHLSLTSPVPPGLYANVTAQTTPAASCSISYVKPGGTAGPDPGLQPQTADANGIVSWTWLIAPDTARGVGSVTVTCNGQVSTLPIQIG